MIWWIPSVVHTWGDIEREGVEGTYLELAMNWKKLGCIYTNLAKDGDIIEPPNSLALNGLPWAWNSSVHAMILFLIGA